MRTPHEKELLLAVHFHHAIRGYSNSTKAIGNGNKNKAEDQDRMADDAYREICFREDGRGWVCGKRSLDREYFLMLDKHDMPLSKCQEESQRFSHIQFSNIYML